MAKALAQPKDKTEKPAKKWMDDFRALLLNMGLTKADADMLFACNNTVVTDCRDDVERKLKTFIRGRKANKEAQKKA